VERREDYWLRTPNGARFRFDPGSLCLAFVYTGGEAERSVFEALHAPADLARWLASSRIGAAVQEVSVEDLAEAKRLREAIWHCAARLAHGQRPRREDLAQLNEVACRPPLVPRIDESWDGGRSWAPPVLVGQALSTIARDAIELFGGPLAARLRECENPDCALIFLDSSRPGRRRWCSMERCGNRLKLRAFRRRGRGAPEPPRDTGPGDPRWANDARRGGSDDRDG
jgi:predicted RNA-binding Zn ribbon-like protein